MVNFIFSIVLLGLSTTNVTTVEIYYKGFWSHSPFPTTIEQLKKKYILSLSVRGSSIPKSYRRILDEEFLPNIDKSVEVEYVFYLVEKSSEGALIREVAGSRDLLFDLTNETFKELSEEEKIKINNYIKDISCDTSDFLPYKKI